MHGYWTPQESLAHINLLEMMAVDRAIDYWLPILRSRHIQILSDNTTVCSYLLHQGGMKSRDLCSLAVRIASKLHASEIQVSCRHIPGRLNVIADDLSRNTPLATEWTLNQEVFVLIQARYPNMEIYLFATRYNKQLPLFVSPFPDPLALGTDGLSLSWENKDLYAFPPSLLIPAILKKLATTHCLLTLVAPLDWNHSWTNSLVQRSLFPPNPLPLRPDLLHQPGLEFRHPRLEDLNLHVWRLLGGALSQEASHDRRLAASFTTREILH